MAFTRTSKGRPGLHDNPRPASLLVWERRERRRFATWSSQSSGCTHITPNAYDEFLAEGRALFFFMYEQLTPAQRQAEAERLNAAIEADPHDESARSDARLWDANVRAWKRHRRRDREGTQSQAIRDAEIALTRCTYLGGYPGFPPRPQRCDARISIGLHGRITFTTRMQRTICEIPWPQITQLHTIPSRQTPLDLRHRRRWQSILHGRGRNQAAIAIHTPDGHTYFLVPELDVSQLHAKLTKLNQCIGQPAADNYYDPRSGIRPQLIR